MKKLVIAVMLLMATLVFCNAQEITVFPGFFGNKYYQDDTRISKGQVEYLMTQDARANMYWQKSKTHNTISWVALGAEVGFLVWQIRNKNNRKSQTVPFIGVLGSAAVAIGFSFSSVNLQKKAILQYNKSKDVSYLDLGITQNGAGLVLSF